MTQGIIGQIGLVIIGVAIAAGVYMANILGTEFIKNTAIDGCYGTAQLIETQEGREIVTPENYWFTKCMQEKGYTPKAK